MPKQLQPALEAPVWKPVEGFEKQYEVSNLGQVRRVKTSSGTWAGRVLNSRPSGRGYVQVCLRKGGEMNVRLMHQLVAEAFLGEKPGSNYVVSHKNGDRADNRVSNLTYVPRGASVLDPDKVREIRRRADEPQTTLAAAFGVAPSTIVAVQRRTRWASVE